MSQDPDRNTNRDDIDTEDLRDHVFDGIREYDKKMPNWWLMTFYGSILFSIVYWLFYHTTGVGLTPEERFAAQRDRLAAESREGGLEDVTAESLFDLSRDEMAVEAGQTAYSSNCAACHGPNLEGGIGSALRNGDWAHGDDPMDIRRAIRDGIPEVGMPPWRQSLGERTINEITAFILSVNPDLEPPAEGDD